MGCSGIAQGEPRIHRKKSAKRPAKPSSPFIRTWAKGRMRACSPRITPRSGYVQLVRFGEKSRSQRTSGGHLGDMRGTKPDKISLVVLRASGHLGDTLSGCQTTWRPGSVAKPIPICPRCGQPATQTLTPTGRKSRCEPCGLWSRGSKPLRDEAGHQAHGARVRARQNAHLCFDPLWKEGLVDREIAYELLARELGIERDACHMSLMGAEVALRVPRAVKSIRASLAAAPEVKTSARPHDPTP